MWESSHQRAVTAPLPLPDLPPRAAHLWAVSDPDDRTTLKWASNGELSELDHQRILRRLCAADPAACQLLDEAETSRSFSPPANASRL